MTFIIECNQKVTIIKKKKKKSDRKIRIMYDINYKSL